MLILVRCGDLGTYSEWTLASASSSFVYPPSILFNVHCLSVIFLSLSLFSLHYRYATIVQLYLLRQWGHYGPPLILLFTSLLQLYISRRGFLSLASCGSSWFPSCGASWFPSCGSSWLFVSSPIFLLFQLEMPWTNLCILQSSNFCRSALHQCIRSSPICKCTDFGVRSQFAPTRWSAGERIKQLAFC